MDATFGDIRVAPLPDLEPPGAPAPLAAVAAASLPLLTGRPFLTGLWSSWVVPGVGKLSSVLLFDVGVYLVVVGTTLLMVGVLAEEAS